MKDKKGKVDIVEERYKNKENTYPNQDQYDTEQTKGAQNSVSSEQSGQTQKQDITGGGG